MPVLLCLTYFSERSVLKVHRCCRMCRNVPPSSGELVPRRVRAPHFVPCLRTDPCAGSVFQLVCITQLFTKLAVGIMLLEHSLRGARGLWLRRSLLGSYLRGLPGGVPGAMTQPSWVSGCMRLQNLQRPPQLQTQLLLFPSLGTLSK